MPGTGRADIVAHGGIREANHNRIVNRISPQAIAIETLFIPKPVVQD